jgi:peptide-methionine (R)-S-oxide reductase
MTSTLASRRGFLTTAIAGGVALAIASCTHAASEPASSVVTIEDFTRDGKSLGKVDVDRIVRTDEEWSKQLTPESYRVTRHEGTEPPYSGEYDKNKASGIYRCICCDTALFNSRTKFDSHTGWPSFWKPISKANVVESSDLSLGMRRTAVACRRCDAHLGHVFEDGPPPTGLRYCMNSVALRFVASA